MQGDNLKILTPRSYVQLSRDDIKRIVHAYVEEQTGRKVDVVSLSEGYGDSAVYLKPEEEAGNAANR